MIWTTLGRWSDKLWMNSFVEIEIIIIIVIMIIVIMKTIIKSSTTIIIIIVYNDTVMG